jgi:hypothetical protein
LWIQLLVNDSCHIAKLSKRAKKLSGHGRKLSRHGRRLSRHGKRLSKPVRRLSKPVRRLKNTPGMKPRHVQRQKLAWRQSKLSSVPYESRVRGCELWISSSCGRRTADLLASGH